MSFFRNALNRFTSSFRERVANPIQERVGNFFGRRSTRNATDLGTDLDTAYSRSRQAAFAEREAARQPPRGFRSNVSNFLEGAFSGLFGRRNEEVPQASSRAPQPVNNVDVDEEGMDTFNRPLDGLPPEIGEPVNITAQYVPPNTSEARLMDIGFSPLGEGMHLNTRLNNANIIQHVDINGVERFLNARNFIQDDLNNPLSLILPRDETDQERRDPDIERQRQASFLQRGGYYRFISVSDPKSIISYSGSGGYFPYFPKEELPFSLLSLGIPKKSELLASHKNYVNRNCLIQCFIDFPDKDKVDKLITMIYAQDTRANHNTLNKICEILERNIILSKWYPKQEKGKGRFKDLLYPSKKKHDEEDENDEGGDESVELPANTKCKYEKSIKIGLISGLFFKYIPDMGQGLSKVYINKCAWKLPKKEQEKLKLDKRAPIASHVLVKDMLMQKSEYFDDFDSDIFKIIEAKNLSDEIIYEKGKQFNVDRDSRPVGEFKEPIKKYSNIIHADTETTNEDKLRVYLICAIVEETGERARFTGEDCVWKFLLWLYRFQKPLVKFCNLAFDVKFMTKDFNSIEKTIENGTNKTYILVGHFNPGNRKGGGKQYTFVDALQQIPIGLGEYQAHFNLEKGKIKNFPYQLYTNESVKLDYLQPRKEDIPELEKLIPKSYWYTYRDCGLEYRRVRHMSFAIDYCYQDIVTQMEGWKIMRERAKEESGIDINNYLTIASYSMAYFHKEGAYEGVYELSGTVQRFIQDCIYGGRCMPSLAAKEEYGSYIINDDSCPEYDLSDESVVSTQDKWEFSRKWYNTKFIKQNPPSKAKILKDRNVNIISGKNKKYIFIDHKQYAVLDANSLYPSAMIKMPGYPIGKPRNLSAEEVESKSFMDTVDDYYVMIKITRVGKKLNFPLMKKRIDGRIRWTNDMVGETIKISKTLLEEVIRYHDIDFEVILGLAFYQGFNHKVGEVMKKLYAKRKQYKAEKNPSEYIIKLQMNMAYGKNYQRAITQRTMYKEQSKWDLLKIYRIHGGTVLCVTDVGKQWKVRVKEGLYEHWSKVHCGCLVLDWSKRIMNRLMVPLDDHILYTDTDSAFIEMNALEKYLEENPGTIGNDMGQFKYEFHIGGTNRRIENMVIISPKIYFYKEMNDEGDTYIKTVMKGIPQSSMDMVVDQKFNGNYEDMYKTILQREDNKGVLFDTTNGGCKLKLEFKPNDDIFRLRDHFVRISKTN